jgi:hypothetical protein
MLGRRTKRFLGRKAPPARDAHKVKIVLYSNPATNNTKGFLSQPVWSFSPRTHYP